MMVFKFKLLNSFLFRINNYLPCRDLNRVLPVRSREHTNVLPCLGEKLLSHCVLNIYYIPKWTDLVVTSRITLLYIEKDGMLYCYFKVNEIGPTQVISVLIYISWKCGQSESSYLTHWSKTYFATMSFNLIMNAVTRLHMAKIHQALF